MSAAPSRLRRLGLLVCGCVRPPFVARYGEYPAMFERLFTALRPSLALVPYAAFRDEWPANLADCDAWLITGSRHSVYEDEPWIRRLEDLVRTLYAERRRTVGICFGHQAIGRALGGRTAKAVQGWGIGRHTAYIVAREPWMEPFAPTYSLYVSHQDQVTVLPPGARLLARSAHCPHAMFALDDVLLGLQGHPEFEVDYARELVLARADTLGADAIAAALSSLTAPADAALLGQWVLHFLED